jgi:hypothetical protein
MMTLRITQIKECFNRQSKNNDNIINIYLAMDLKIIFKYKGGFYSAAYILADKDNNMDYIWVLLVLRILLYVKKKSQEENRFI